MLRSLNFSKLFETLTDLRYLTFFAILVPLLVFLYSATYNIHLHPLSSYPGPKLWAGTRLSWIWWSIRGELVEKLLEFHEKYGHVVRIGPNELSYTSDAAWRTIYGQRAVEMMKDLYGPGFLKSPTGFDSIVSADRASHPRMRRLLSHAFSEKALREQEPYLQEYVSRLMLKLRERMSQGPQDLVRWFNYVCETLDSGDEYGLGVEFADLLKTTFDLIGDLSYGKPLGCLDDSQYHPWVAEIFESIKVYPLMQALTYYKMMSLLKYVTPKSLIEARKKTMENLTQQLDRRLAIDVDRKDFLSFILKEGEGKFIDKGEIRANTNVLMIAGSETIATQLSGTVYHVLSNPDCHRQLVREIRDTFQTEEQITMQSVFRLKYMRAVLEESMRIYPPAPSTVPRVVPPTGEIIDGRFVPAGTTVGVNHFAAYHSKRNFHRPNEFLPGRFLPSALESSSPFSNDNRAVFQPFSYGPRSCLGKNLTSLAYAELRLITAHLFWNFDMELDLSSLEWQRYQRTYFLWEKPPLMVHLRPAT